MKLKGVVFDFNGTLFWDTKLHNRAWDIFLAKNGFVLSNQEKMDKIHGKNNQTILSNIFLKELSESDVEALTIEKETIYQELCLQEKMELAPGAVAFFCFLKSSQIPFTIATASGIENINFYFEHLALNKFFDRSKIVFSDGLIPSKPDPQIFLKAIDILEIKNQETLIIEDSFAGIRAAENAKAGKIIIVDSNNDDYQKWDYQKIQNFNEVDRTLFV